MNLNISYVSTRYPTPARRYRLLCGCGQQRTVAQDMRVCFLFFYILSFITIQHGEIK